MAESIEKKSWTKKLQDSKALRWGVGIPVALALVLYLVSFILDEPLRSIIEKKINRNLKGYSVRLPGVHVHLIGLSLTLKGLTVLQQAHPNPPVVYFPIVKATIHWREILSGRRVAEVMLDQPTLNSNLQQDTNEISNQDFFIQVLKADSR